MEGGAEHVLDLVSRPDDSDRHRREPKLARGPQSIAPVENNTSRRDGERLVEPPISYVGKKGRVLVRRHRRHEVRSVVLAKLGRCSLLGHQPEHAGNEPARIGT